jgi:hypothetical protein
VHRVDHVMTCDRCGAAHHLEHCPYSHIAIGVRLQNVSAIQERGRYNVESASDLDIKFGHILIAPKSNN